MSKPTKYGRCGGSKLARDARGFCAWGHATKAPSSCPLLPGSKRKPTKRTKG